MKLKEFLENYLEKHWNESWEVIIEQGADKLPFHDLEYLKRKFGNLELYLVWANIEDNQISMELDFRVGGTLVEFYSRYVDINDVVIPDVIRAAIALRELGK